MKGTALEEVHIDIISLSVVPLYSLSLSVNPVILNLGVKLQPEPLDMADTLMAAKVDTVGTRLFARILRDSHSIRLMISRCSLCRAVSLTSESTKSFE